MKEYKYRVDIKHKITGERICIEVWSQSTDAATTKLAGVIIGYGCEYEWIGTGPVYENGKMVSKNVPA